MHLMIAPVPSVLYEIKYSAADRITAAEAIMISVLTNPGTNLSLLLSSCAAMLAAPIMSTFAGNERPTHDAASIPHASIIYVQESYLLS